MAKKIGDLGFQSRLYANLAAAYCALTNRCDEQDVGAAHAVIDLDRFELAEAADEPQLLFPCYDGLATAHLALRDEGRAEEFMQKAQAVCERAGLEPDALVVLPFLD
jgi:adenylate cyclase